MLGSAHAWRLEPAVHELGVEALADVRADADRLVEIIRQLETETEAADNFAQTAIAAGKLREVVNRYGAAAAWYRAALDYDPDCEEALARLAVVTLKSGRIDVGLRLAEDLVARDSAMPVRSIGDGFRTTATGVLADALQLAGQPEAAIDAFRAALALQGEDTYARSSLLGLLVSSRRLDEAQALAADLPARPEFAATLAILRLSTNESDELPALLGEFASLHLPARV